jgi:hypothetical protein
MSPYPRTIPGASTPRTRVRDRPVLLVGWSCQLSGTGRVTSSPLTAVSQRSRKTEQFRSSNLRYCRHGSDERNRNQTAFDHE